MQHRCSSLTRFLFLGGLSIVVSSGAVSSISAQAGIPDGPAQIGQWAGPYDLTDGLTEAGQYITGEIVHSAVLPPAAGFPDVARVVLCCDPTPALTCSGCEITSTGGQKFGRTYLWLPTLPSNAFPIAVPSYYPQDGSQDFFCGTHAFLPDGDLLWAGGTDFLVSGIVGAGCPIGTGCGFHGHPWAWRLATGQPVPIWVPSSGTNTMQTPRGTVRR